MEHQSHPYAAVSGSSSVFETFEIETNDARDEPLLLSSNSRRPGSDRSLDSLRRSFRWLTGQTDSRDEYASSFISDGSDQDSAAQQQASHHRHQQQQEDYRDVATWQYRQQTGLQEWINSGHGSLISSLQNSGGYSFLRNGILVLVALAVMVHLAMDRRDEEAMKVQSIDGSSLNNPVENQGPISTTSSGLDVAHHNNIPVFDTEKELHPHQYSEESHSFHHFTFGGNHNYGHIADPTKSKEQNKQQLDQKELEAEILQEASGLEDISAENIVNEQGHYLHDPLRSPFASPSYAVDQAELERRQQDFEARMNATIDKFGCWEKPMSQTLFLNPTDRFFDDFDFRDAPIDEFPERSWQKNEEYIRMLIQQGISLVDATKKGIMEEYNHRDPTKAEMKLFQVAIGDHEVINGTALDPEHLRKRKGIAYMSQESWDALVRKLLHTMITMDHFYVVVAGGAEAYQANNFAQSQVMQFNKLMEPIFQKLGMKLISRNMATSTSTAISALGLASIYGETDILWHVQDFLAEEKPGEYDLLQRQAIMSRDRVPLILSPDTDEIVLSSKGKAWTGHIQPGAEVCDFTKNKILPDTPACHHVRCDAKAYEDGLCPSYNSVCWENRWDWNPVFEQDDNIGNQDQQYPGFRQHQLEGRKLSLLLLHALKAALVQWKNILDVDSSQLPLAAEHWHVKQHYTDVRKAVMTLDRNPGEAAGFSASCEFLLKSLDPRICHIPMHAYSEWTPRSKPDDKSLLKIIINSIESYDKDTDSAYDGPDLLPSAWQLQASEIDVHMIAIAANTSDMMDSDSADNDGGRNLQVRSKAYLKTRSRSTKEDNSNARTLDVEVYDGESLPIESGEGWALIDAPVGFCDGSAQSVCNRTTANKCLLGNHNHYKGYVAGTPKNGWLRLSPPPIFYGIILVRLEFVSSSSSSSILPGDFMFDYAISGEVKSVKGSDLNRFGQTIVNDLTVYPLVLNNETGLIGDESGVTYDVAMRIRSEDDPDCTMKLSHLYYA